VKGEHRSLYKNGSLNVPNMKKSAISEDDLKESIRVAINSNSLEDVQEAVFEKNGHVSVVRKKTK
ncbi:MAG TPA: YetF domain-containing protein, partial [Chitinophagaceae bacterium]